MSETIDFSDFLKVEMRAGKVLRVEPFPEARKPAYKLWIDFGELGEKKTSAQITQLYQPDDLVDEFVIAVTNFPPKQIGKFMSEVLVLGIVGDEGEVVLLRPERPVVPGQRVY